MPLSNGTSAKELSLRRTIFSTRSQAMGLLAQFPIVGKAAAHNTRMLPLHKFPYSLIYRLQGDVVRIIAVAHHSRRPGYWVGRR